MEKIAVLGIGNILMKDEGLGVRTIELLTARYQLSPDVQILDGGCLGMELYPFLESVGKLLVVDAVDAQLSPGSCCKFTGDEVEKYFRRKLSVHEIGITEVLASLELTAHPINEVVIVGMQPALLDIGLELSNEVQAALHQLLDMVVDQLRAWDVEVVAKGE